MTKKEIVMTMKKYLYEARYNHAYFGIKKGWENRVTEDYNQREAILCALLADCKVLYLLSGWFVSAFRHGKEDAKAKKAYHLAHVQELAEKEVN